MSIYEDVTNRILNQLESGRIPWRKTWTTGLPKNLTTGKEYRGINILALSVAERTSSYWMTYRQALHLGGHVRKGEKSTMVIYWKWRTPEELKRLEEKTGRSNLAPCVPFTSAVFNLDQVENVACPDDQSSSRDNRRLEIAELMLDLMPDKPEIVHAAMANPAYSPALDRVMLPQLSQFENADEYYGTLFHELVHSTGHTKRLNRFAEADGNRLEEYSFEELVAEFGAAFLCGFAGIANEETEALQTSYIEGWSRALRKEPRLILSAASAAQRAADYIRGKIVTEEIAVAA